MIAPGTTSLPEAACLLGIECAGARIGVAILAGGKPLFHRVREARHGQAEQLAPMIAAAMETAGLSFPALDGIAVGIGPGGFTGLRVAIATAKGLSLALGKPAIGISNFQATAANLPADFGAPDPGAPSLGAPILVLIDSRREEPYAAWLSPDLTYRRAPALRSWDALAAEAAEEGKAILTGDAAMLWPGSPPPSLRHVPAFADALAVARLAGNPVFALPAAPLYLRPPDTNLPHAAG